MDGHALLDRAGERTRIDRLLMDVRAGASGVLVVRGQAGIGKTSLLRYATRRASAFQVAHVGAVEAEMELPLAGLHQLCVGMLDGLDLLPEALDAAGEEIFGVPAALLLFVGGFLGAHMVERLLAVRQASHGGGEHDGRTPQVGLTAAAATIAASPKARRAIRDAGLDAADSASNAANNMMSSASKLGSLIAEAVADAAQRVLSGKWVDEAEAAVSKAATSAKNAVGLKSAPAKSGAAKKAPARRKPAAPDRPPLPGGSRLTCSSTSRS